MIASTPATPEPFTDCVADLVAFVDDDGMLTWLGGRLASGITWHPGGSLGQPWQTLIAGDMGRAVDLFEEARQVPRRPATAQLDLGLADQGAQSYSVTVTDLTDVGGPAAFVVAAHNVDRLRWLAFTDPLTGLANRALLNDRLDHALARGMRNGCDTTVLFIDMDEFKGLNDSLGHVAGDEILCAIGRAITTSVRPNDTVARFGGDEFVVVLEDARDADDAVRRVLDAIARPLLVDGEWVLPSASVGVATGNGVPGAELLRMADRDLRRAKDRRLAVRRRACRGR
jgi:diguanylate cyclase (GGDEF)-like protein